MFALPEAKRVRREDLNGSDASSASDNEEDIQAREKLEAQIARSLGIEVSVAPPSKPPAAPSKPTALETEGSDVEDEEVEDAPEEYDFCLFGGSAAPATTKVILEHDEELKGDGAILSNRPSSYYLAKKYTPEEKENFAAAAITADQIIALSAHRRWTDELPWKVTHITVHTNGPTPSQGDADKRRRPGKKRRLAMKVKERRKREKDDEKKRKKEETKLREEEKEEHIKEKKKRLNRARKLKRREKAREEKRARGEEVPDEEDSGLE